MVKILGSWPTVLGHLPGTVIILIILLLGQPHTPSGIKFRSISIPLFTVDGTAYTASPMPNVRNIPLKWSRSKSAGGVHIIGPRKVAVVSTSRGLEKWRWCPRQGASSPIASHRRRRRQRLVLARGSGRWRTCWRWTLSLEVDTEGRSRRRARQSMS